MSNAKRQLLDKWRQGHDLAAERLAIPRTKQERIPLSFAQERLWFLDQMTIADPFYNIPIVLRTREDLDVMVFAQSMTEVVRRHEILRTTFRVEGGIPRQVIDRPQRIEVTAIDMRGLGEQDREAEIQRLIVEEARRPFDLGHGPLWRLKVLRTREEEYVIALTVHHIVADGWSIGILLQELLILYRNFLAGQPSPLSELPVQYGDYAVWQREWLQGEVLDRELRYWREQLQGASVLELPTDRPRPAIQSFRGATCPLFIEEDIYKKLKDLSRREGATLFMTLFAAFTTLVYRYTGQEDISVGSPIAGRRRSEIEGLIGFFVNTLVLRTELDGGG